MPARPFSLHTRHLFELATKRIPRLAPADAFENSQQKGKCQKSKRQLRRCGAIRKGKPIAGIDPDGKGLYAKVGHGAEIRDGFHPDQHGT